MMAVSATTPPSPKLSHSHTWGCMGFRCCPAKTIKLRRQFQNRGGGTRSKGCQMYTSCAVRTAPITLDTGVQALYPIKNVHRVFAVGAAQIAEVCCWCGPITLDKGEGGISRDSSRSQMLTKYEGKFVPALKQQHCKCK